MEIDLDEAAKSILVGKKIDKMLDIVADAKEMRKAFKISHDVAKLDANSVAIGLAQTSDEFFSEFETTLYEIAEMARDKVDAVEIKHTMLVEAFIVFISELKPRSIRHLENFLSAATDGEFVDSLFIAHGKDSEVRCIDRCSDDTKANFGLK